MSALETTDSKSDCKEETGPLTHERTTFNTACIIFICTLAMIYNISAGVALSTSLPFLANDLHIDENQLQWVVSSYTLTSGCFLLLLGRIADLHGRKKVFIAGMAWFAAWSLGCGFAKNAIALDIMRGFQGIGSAAIVPAAIGILAQSFPPSRTRTMAFAIFSAGAPLGGALGNVSGSLLTQYASISWRAVFFLSTGLAVATALLAWFVVDSDVIDSEEDRRVDWLGAALVTVGLVLLTFVLGQGEVAPQQWKTSYIIALFVVSIVILALFVAWEHYVEKNMTLPPLMRLSLWTRAGGRFAVVQGIAFLTWAGFTSWLFFAVLYYESYQGLSPVNTMIRLLPMAVAGLILNVIVFLIVARVTGDIIIGIGALCTGAGCLLFAVIKPSASYWAFGFPSATLAVVGADFIFSSCSLFTAKIALPEEQSLAAGVFNTLVQFGGAAGLAVTTVLYDQIAKKETVKILGHPTALTDSAAPRDALLKGYRAAQWLNFAFLMAALGLTIIFLRGIGYVGHAKVKAASDQESQESSDDGEK
ncbi:hypothetical protein BOTBODRAFT_437663 [Botryobasidium botryosum FD-172 SS1]|uniref:Major facilitator superfamily (MFS) profile domain-containing protein n=1 Tax=Botryobasidium botryosum (strain FD-172 SS1) TaxID=930990 RepID=A0A067MUW0_BOTB1|nr:hypothetical protein BOTBODRAFT_437663 [Botryobasidium botryosum FD-172 SS1]